MKNEKHKKLIIGLSITLCIIISITIAFSIYVGIYYKASDTAKELAVTNNPNYDIQNIGKNIAFVPKNTEVGLIFYPGGKVEYTAYVPLLSALAEKGVLTILVKMPCNLAVFNPNAADKIIKHFNNDIEWYIGGHSLGGAMAATYVSKHQSTYAGLLLLGAYSTADLSNSSLTIISIFGSQDKIMNKSKYDKYKQNLPIGFGEFIIDGGCHSFFGDYGMQKGDGTPTITRDEQISITTNIFVSCVGLGL